MRIIPLFVLCTLLLATTVFAEQTGSVNVEYISAQSDCSVEETNAFTAGDIVYVKATLTNTGDEDLINAQLYSLDELDGVWGKYPHDIVTMNIPVGSAIVYCYPLDTTTSYESGTWTGTAYFRTANSVVMHLQQYYFDIKNEGTYEAVTVSQDAGDPITTSVGTSKDFTITVVNENPEAEFKGLLYIGQAFFKDGTTSKDITIPAGKQLEFPAYTKLYNEPFQSWVGIHVESVDGRPLQRRWYSYVVGEDTYLYRIHQLYADKSVYQPGEKGTVSAYVNNLGSATWDGEESYRFLVEAETKSGWETLLDEKARFKGHAPNTYELYTSSEFTVPADGVMSNFRVYFFALEPDGTEMSRHGGNVAYYSADAYPDQSASCSRTSGEDENGITLIETCQANGYSTIFVPAADGDLSTITAKRGSLNLYWGGSKDGVSGYYLQGSTDAVYELTYLMYETIEADALSFSLPFLGLTLLLFLFLYRRQ